MGPIEGYGDCEASSDPAAGEVSESVVGSRHNSAAAANAKKRAALLGELSQVFRQRNGRISSGEAEYGEACDEAECGTSGPEQPLNAVPDQQSSSPQLHQNAAAFRQLLERSLR